MSFLQVPPPPPLPLPTTTTLPLPTTTTTLPSSSSSSSSTLLLSSSSQKEIYTYHADWMIYSTSWSVRRDYPFRLAIGSFIEEYRNKVDIIQLNTDRLVLERVAQFEHPYPATKIQFHPSSSTSNLDLIATSGDYLRLWQLKDHSTINNNTTNGTTIGTTTSNHMTSVMVGRDEMNQQPPISTTTTSFTAVSDKSTTMKSNTNNTNTTNNNNTNTTTNSLIQSQTQHSQQFSVSKYFTFNNDSSSEYCAPLTSFDWCEYNPNIIGTCSIDTTCTIWDIPSGKSVTQLIAHDKEVYDIAFRNQDVFCTVGADGSLRMFDLRSLEHCSILYETPQLTPLLRLAWNKQDLNYVACIGMDSNRIVVLDVRYPGMPLMELCGHKMPVNGIAWAPHSPRHLCSVGDDGQALIWDINNGGMSSVGIETSGTTIEPILEYKAECEVNQLGWSSLQMDWISIVFGQKLQILKV
ncbi:hypothetical protein FDP41_002379 [Naegleria fowleri]|uniref:Uncharacterized protein n=1 Tax=Naegleria fowleri TaxID=5763 RepID=A0A6A5BZX0_NAEFO|nr:uncharacterized protein FDP41_002379 [Naegleria fowleri]KAF0978559.1 hypothetical protein FDP41_002379 [Naegleria fowleri]